MLNQSAFPSNTVVLVTGAASGIGYATAELLLKRGARVAAVDLNWTNQAKGGLTGALIIQSDVSEETDCIASIAQVKDAYKSIDVLVNCAGITRRASVVNTTTEEWNQVINVNLRSVYLMSRYTLKIMLDKKSGNIINVASGWGLIGGARAAAYCASKGGVVLLTKAMAVDHSPDGIRINCVCPGDTDTPMLRFEAQELGLSAQALLSAAHARPMGRAGHPSEIAEVIIFLASPAASFITGSALVVDGGSLAGSP